MFIRARHVRFALAVVFFLPAIAPAAAYTWPGEDASLGAAIAAKVIGEQCLGVLPASEIGELEAYISKVIAEDEANKGRDGTHRPFPREEFRKQLASGYAKKYSDPKNCGADAVEEARDTLQRVRKALASGKPLYRAVTGPDGKPDVGDVVMARVTGDQCKGTLTALELAELELYTAKYWVSFARTATDEDTRYTMQLYKKMERDFGSSKDCSAERVAQVKDLAARVRKSGDPKAQ